MEQQHFSREQLERSLRKFKDIVSDLFSAEFQAWGDQLTHLLTHCEQDPVMDAVMEPLRANRNVDAAKWYADALASQSSMVGSGQYKLPYDDDDRTALLYQFFLMLENDQAEFVKFCLTMYGHSRYQDMVDTFNRELVEKFTREVSYRLDKVMRDMGYNQEISKEAMVVIFNHQDHSMNVQGHISGSNIAVDGSTVSNSSANVTTINDNADLLQAVQALRNLMSQVEQDKQQEVEASIEVLEGAVVDTSISRSAIAKSVEIVSQVPVMRQHLENLAIGVGGNLAASGLVEAIRFVLGG